MNERLSRWVAAWLAHPTGIAQALVTTAGWFAAPFAFHWPWHSVIFWYLGYCTFISFATQFTIAYQNQKAEAALELTLRNMTDMMRLDIALAEQIDAALLRLDDGVDRLIEFATTEQQIQAAVVKQDEGIAAGIASVINLLEAREKLKVPLNKLLSGGNDEKDAEPDTEQVLPVDAGPLAAPETP